jgi:SAM-dependent methyltransferase
MAEKIESLPQDYFDFYNDAQNYEESFEETFDEESVVDLIEIVWAVSPPYKLLDAGSASGLTLAAFDHVGIEAWGIENNAYIHNRTAPEWKHRNLLGDVQSLPFEDNSFDFVYDTSLCYIAEEHLDRCIKELHRVARRGILFYDITRDISLEILQHYDSLFYGLKTLDTAEKWSERFLRNGFQLAINAEHILEKVWQYEIESSEGNPWYCSPSSMRYCFYSKVNNDVSD